MHYGEWRDLTGLGSVLKLTRVARPNPAARAKEKPLGLGLATRDYCTLYHG